MNLPGTIHKAYVEDKCENHLDRQAVVNVQGETDSFGCELHPFCQECYDAYQTAKAIAPPMVGVCDWCKTDNKELLPTRDYDEGSSGPVYYVCQSCRRNRELAAQKEIEEMEQDDYITADYGDDLAWE